MATRSSCSLCCVSSDSDQDPFLSPHLLSPTSLPSSLPSSRQLLRGRYFNLTMLRSFSSFENTFLILSLTFYLSSSRRPSGLLSTKLPLNLYRDTFACSRLDNCSQYRATHVVCRKRIRSYASVRTNQMVRERKHVKQSKVVHVHIYLEDIFLLLLTC